MLNTQFLHKATTTTITKQKKNKTKRQIKGTSKRNTIKKYKIQWVFILYYTENVCVSTLFLVAEMRRIPCHGIAMTYTYFILQFKQFWFFFFFLLSLPFFLCEKDKIMYWIIELGWKFYENYTKAVCTYCVKYGLFWQWIECLKFIAQFS